MLDSPRITLTQLFIVSRSQAQRTTRISTHLLPLSICPTFRKLIIYSIVKYMCIDCWLHILILSFHTRTAQVTNLSDPLELHCLGTWHLCGVPINTAICLCACNNWRIAVQILISSSHLIFVLTKVVFVNQKSELRSTVKETFSLSFTNHGYFIAIVRGGTTCICN
jgi:hypothetical protein